MSFIATDPDWASEWTAIGTVGLAFMTVVAVVVTIVITVQDRRRADRQLADERQRALDVEQHAQANGVSVGVSSLIEPDRGLRATVVNQSAYAIREVDLQFSPDGKTLAPCDHIDGAAPNDAGYLSDGAVLLRTGHVMFASDQAAARRAGDAPYAVLRWTDQWDIRWEHKKGSVRKVDPGEPWTP